MYYERRLYEEIPAPRPQSPLGSSPPLGRVRVQVLVRNGLGWQILESPPSRSMYDLPETLCGVTGPTTAYRSNREWPRGFRSRGYRDVVQTKETTTSAPLNRNFLSPFGALYQNRENRRRERPAMLTENLRFASSLQEVLEDRFQLPASLSRGGQVQSLTDVIPGSL